MLENNKRYLAALDSVADTGFDYGKLKNKSILVTGSTGLIGKALVDYILLISDKFGLNITLYGAGRSEENFNARFSKKNNLHYFSYDINKPVNTSIHFDYIIHAASNADPKMFAADPVGTMTANFMGTYNLLEYAQKSSSERFVFISSGEVYGQWDGICESFSENYSGYVNFTDSRGCYPSGKRAAENLVVCYKEQYGVDGVIVRLSHTYGPTQLKRDSRAMSEFFNLAVENKNIVLKSRGEVVRSYTCVFDAVSGIISALIAGESGQAYNIANKNSVVSIASLAEKIAACAQTEVVFDIPREGVKGAGSIAQGILNGEKLQLLGWKPVYDIDKGVKTTYEIMREEHERDE